MVRVADLEDSPQNFRTHPEEQQAGLEAVVEEIGWFGYPDVFETEAGKLRLCDGHLRKTLLLRKYGPDAEIEVNVTDFSETEALKALATKDPLAAMAGCDDAALAALLASIECDTPAMDALLKEVAEQYELPPTAPAAQGDPDEVPDVPVVPTTETGDLWILGEHRLLCCDARNSDDMALLMDGQKATVCFTDPPYGVSIGAKNRLLNSVQPSGRNLTDVVDDGLTPEQLEAELLTTFVNIREIAMAEDCTLFVCSPQGCGLSMMMMMMQSAGLKARHVLIWVKNQPTFSMGRLDYDYQHEPILLTWLKRHKRPMAGPFKTSVWNVDKPRKCDVHPTMKPVELYANAYLNNSEDGDRVFDPHSGSGTAFIAAEQVGRIAYGSEISPHYCDVIAERYFKFCGKMPILEATGETFAQVKERRAAEKAITSAAGTPAIP